MRLLPAIALLMLTFGFSAPVIADGQSDAAPLPWLAPGGKPVSDDDAVLAVLMQWQRALDPDSGAGFEEIQQFIDEHADWPLQNKLRVRAELALQNDTVSADRIIAFFADQTPLTGYGKIALAEAFAQTGRNKDKLSKLIREGWVNGDFSKETEERIRTAYSDMIRSQDDIARAERLLWDEKIGAAKRMLTLLPADYQHLCKARIALIENKSSVSFVMLLVPSSLKNNDGLIYDRMRYRARRGDDVGVREMLLLAPAKPSYPEKWWKYREQQVREAIDENNFKLAQKLLANHGQADGQTLAEARWLSGWLDLEFLNKPAEALVSFEALYRAVKFPVSKARAAYWAGAAAEQSGQDESARQWYSAASRYPTSFYGQLAALKAFGTEPLNFPDPPTVGEAYRQQFAQSEMSRAITIAMQYGGADLASRLISLGIENTTDKEEALLFAQIGDTISNPYLSVRGAKKASQMHNLVLIKEGFPMPEIPGDLPIEKSLAFAISRQESEFDPLAKSPSGAIGMMQLLPSTAKETAKKLGIAYSVSALHEPDYNMRLGSHYLNRMIDSYSGSYVMAIAAYNAGPGNVRRWTMQFGTPGSEMRGVINWIEKIPFAETRSYVQRVLENLQVYRHLEQTEASRRLLIGEDLVR